MTKTKKPAEIWKTAHSELKLQMTRAAFDTWLRDAHLVEEEGDAFVIGVPNVYARDWLEHRLKGVVVRTLKQVAGRYIDVKFIIHTKRTPKDDDLSDAGPLLAQLKPKESKSSKNGHHEASDGLNERYTFESFVEGASNRLARAVALSAAETPGKLANPLFITGDVGMGKSHLLHAIGNLAKKRGLNVLLVPAETFTNDLVESIRTQSTAKMREKYRSVDMLLVDDVQFIAGKENTQEEFFHTFNALYDKDKQIVVTGDTPPREISGMEARLRSRLEGGMIAHLKPPSLETRIDIVRAKSRGRKKNLSNSVLEFIARKADGNVRQLEGAVTRVLARAELTATDPSLALAEATLGDLTARKTSLTLDQIVLAVATVYRLDVDVLKGRSRTRVVSLARQVAMYLAREEADIPLPQIGSGMGGRNHSTVLYSCKRISDKLRTDRLLRSQVTSVQRALEGSKSTQQRPAAVAR